MLRHAVSTLRRGLRAARLVQLPRARPLATRAELAAAAAHRAAPLSPRVAALFSQIGAGLAGMASENAGFRVELVDAATLHVHTGRGAARFTFSFDATRGVVTFASPKVSHAGGAHDYKYSGASGHWVSTTDGHFLLELLVRDLIHAVPGGLRGVPNF